MRCACNAEAAEWRRLVTDHPQNEYHVGSGKNIAEGRCDHCRLLEKSTRF